MISVFEPGFEPRKKLGPFCQKSDTTSIRQASIGKVSIGQASVSQVRRLVKYVDSSSREGMRGFVKYLNLNSRNN